MPETPERRVGPVHQPPRAWRVGRLLAGTRRAHLYFPTARHPSWAVQP